MSDFHNDFMKLGDMSDIDNRILAEAGQDDLIDRMHEEKDKEAARKSPWTREVRENWFLYALLFISLLLTETLAIYIGMAPRLVADPASPTGQSIHFNNDIGHLLTTLIYMLVFPLVTELAFDNARKKFNRRENGNWQQTWTMGLSVVVSVISWVGTGVAGAYVIMATLGSLGFIEIPKSVQTWLIWIIPILLAFFALMNWLYEAGSRYAKSKKMADEKEKNAELADQMRMQEIERAGKRAIRAAAIRSYEQAVALGLLSQAEADTALAQGMSLADLERKLNRDITGEGKIGDTSGLTHSLPKGALPAEPSYHPVDLTPRPIKHYTTDEWLKFTNMTRAEAFSMFQMLDFETPTKAWHRCYMDYGMIPPGMTFSNFKEIYHNIRIEDFPGKERFQNYGPAGAPARTPASRVNGTENFQ